MSLPAEEMWDDFKEHEYEELRLALAMTGGVSLAVWMGGVAMEINRVVRQDPLKPQKGRTKTSGVYRELLRLVGCHPRVDIIAGTSAGGLNGALLAAAMTHDKELSSLKDLWLQKATLLKLFRSPFGPDAPSLMKGDQYFLGELEAAFTEMDSRPPTWSVSEMPLQLIMTTTLLNGVPSTFTDDFGLVLPDVSHQGEFTFVRDPETLRDDFTKADVVRRLALGARSSASFPGAFEASFVPVGKETQKPPRSDMDGSVSFQKSRWVVDGGVLVNKPIRPVIREMFAQRAREKRVRRVLAYIVPDPGVIPEDVSDDEDDVPTLGTVAVASLISLPRSESVAGELRDIRDHNRRAKAQRALRERLLDPDFGCDVAPMAKDLFGLYRQFLAQAIVYSIQQDMNPHRAQAAGMTDEAWQILRDLLMRERSPWVPFSLDSSDTRWSVGTAEAAAAIVLDLVNRALGLSHLRESPFVADRQTLVRNRSAVHNALTWLRRLREFETKNWRAEAEALLTALEAPETPGRAGARMEKGPESRIEAFLESWISKRPRTWHAPNHPPDPHPHEVVRYLSDLATSLHGLLGSVPGASLEWDETHGVLTEEERQGVRFVQSLARHLFAGNREGEAFDPTRGLLELSVMQYTLFAGMPTIDQPVEFIQVSANAENGIDKRASVEEKLAGVQLGHFGAFYKRSWRANDWMWGRLDGTQRLIQVLLSPARLRERGLRSGLNGSPLVESTLAHIHALAVPSENDDAESSTLLEERWTLEVDVIRGELSFLMSPNRTPPRMLPSAANAVARRIQLTILQEELLEVGRSLDLDEQIGGALSTEAQEFLNGIEDAMRTSHASPGLREGVIRSAARRALRRGRLLAAPEELLKPRDAWNLFRKCMVGRERIAKEVGSDLFTSTTATAGAVGISALSGKRGGLGLLRPVLASMRGLVLTLYLLARGAVSGSRTGFAVMAMLLAAGAALLAVSLPEVVASPIKDIFDDSRPWIGLALLSAGLFGLALRAGALAAGGYVLLSAAVAIGPFVWLRYRLLPGHADSKSLFWKALDWVEPAVPLIALVLAFSLLGVVRSHRPTQQALRYLPAAAAIAVFAVAVSIYPQPSEAGGLFLVPVSGSLSGLVLAWLSRRAISLS